MLKFVTKKLLYPSKKAAPKYGHGARLTFHFKTERTDVPEEDPMRVVDDSKKPDKPMQLLLGKQFKMPVWEYCLRTMRVDEVSEFLIDAFTLDTYPVVSQGYRQYAGVGKTPKHRCCGMAKEQTGYKDLDQLVAKPCNLKFTFEMVNVEETDEYEKEVWSMTAEEKVAKLPFLRESGNKLFVEGNVCEAEKRYGEAIGILEGLMLMEKPHDEEWNALDNQKIPYLLNYAQCKLLQKDYYEVIRHTTQVLEKDVNNPKALYRRAKAHIAAWNPEEARKDLARLVKVNPSLKSSVLCDLSLIAQEEKRLDQGGSEKLKKLFQQ